MSLVEHLRELRSRLFRAVVAVVVGTTVAWFFYGPLSAALSDPYTEVARQLAAEGIEVELAVIGSIVDPFVLQLKMSAYAGIVLASPIWLYQLWAFVTPGLHRNERRYTLGFVAMAAPLFLAGVALCYWALPKGIGILLEFTPSGAKALTSFDDYLNFFLRMMLIFGFGFVMPVFVVLLNLLGVVSAKTLVRSRSWVVIGIFVFAAVATPTGDPFNMLLVALPMTLLYLGAEVVCRIHDRRHPADDEAIGDYVPDEAAEHVPDEAIQIGDDIP